MIENPRMLVVFYSEKYSIANQFLIDSQQANEWKSKSVGCFLLGKILYSIPCPHVVQHVIPNVDQHVGTVCGRLYLLILKQNLATVFREDIHPE